MDAIDRKILHKLQENARATLSDLSGEAALSIPAVSERLKKLEASGVIRQYTTILDPAMLNKHLMALMFLRFDSPKHGDRFSDFVRNEPEIKECYYITGDFDYSLKIVTENTGTLEKLLTVMHIVDTHSHLWTYQTQTVSNIHLLFFPHYLWIQQF